MLEVLGLGVVLPAAYMISGFGGCWKPDGVLNRLACREAGTGI